MNGHRIYPPTIFDPAALAEDIQGHHFEYQGPEACFSVVFIPHAKRFFDDGKSVPILKYFTRDVAERGTVKLTEGQPLVMDNESIFGSVEGYFFQMDLQHYDETITQITDERKQQMNKWDQRFIDLAKHIAEWSKDETKVGAVIVDRDRRIVATGYNGFPRGVDELPERTGRPAKYAYTCHAERNALDNRFTNVDDCTMYCTLFPCSDCAKSIIQSGITHLVVDLYDSSRVNSGYLESWEMLTEAGIYVEVINRI